jgi:hypothetical protein
MNSRPAGLAVAVMLTASGAAATFAMGPPTEEEPVCSGRAPFREVAQDEIYTFDELCQMRDDFVPAHRGRIGTIGWARGHPAVPTR